MLMLLHPKTKLSTCKQSLFPCLLSITSMTIPSSKSLLPFKHFSLFCFISMLAVNHFQYHTLFQVLAPCKSLSSPYLFLLFTAKTLPSLCLCFMSSTVTPLPCSVKYCQYFTLIHVLASVNHGHFTFSVFLFLFRHNL